MTWLQARPLRLAREDWPVVWGAGAGAGPGQIAGASPDGEVIIGGCGRAGAGAGEGGRAGAGAGEGAGEGARAGAGPGAGATAGLGAGTGDIVKVMIVKPSGWSGLLRAILTKLSCCHQNIQMTQVACTKYVHSEVKS